MIQKFLFQPVTPFVITQGFGEDRLCVANDGSKKLLVKDTNQTCPIGYTSLYANTNGHNGLDLRAARWQPVYAAHSGIVTEVQTDVQRGLGCGIVTDKQWYCQESGKLEHFKTRYWHFIALDVHIGEKIKVGDLIGYADSTGYSTADHLHLELKPVKILEWENGVPIYNNVLQNNTHLGAVNPLPYLENISALTFAGLFRQVAELAARLADYLADLARTGLRSK